MLGEGGIMATVDPSLAAEAEPITLYFALAPGKKADMEVAARAAIAFAESVRELAQLFDPFAEVRVELASGTDSSLGLNGLIRKVRGFPGKHPGWTAFLIAVAVNISGDVRTWTVEKVLDFMAGGDAPKIVHHMPEADRHAIAQEVVDMLRNEPAKKPTRQIFREVQQDPAIEGVGVTAVPHKRPDFIIPRSDFPRASGEISELVETPQHRVTRERMRVTIKKLRLEAVVASWRFQQGSMPEFSAEMRDKAFLKAFEEGRIELPLRIGAEMEIELETEWHFEGGVWVVKRRSVTRVFWPEARSAPLGLFPDK
jgi:hypothetical protein